MKRYKTRLPEIKTREEEKPEPQKRNPRMYIPASMPVVCPKCGHSTRMADGRYVDPAHKTILEYRTCSKCGAKLAAGRAMTPREAETLCSRVDAIAEYHESLK